MSIMVGPVRWANATLIEINVFGVNGSIAPLFNIFKCLDRCHLNVVDTKICSKCTFTEKESRRIGPLISLNGNNVNKVGINKSLQNYLASTQWTCYVCNNISETNREVFSFPSTMFLILDLSFPRLKKFSNYQEIIELSNSKYQLNAAITKPSENHFGLLLKEPKNILTNKKHTGWYLYDDMLNNGDIIPIKDDFVRTLNKNNGYILIYQRKILYKK